MLHFESDWTCLQGICRQAQTEGYDGVFHREFVVRKGHDPGFSEHLAGQSLDFQR